MSTAHSSTSCMIAHGDCLALLPAVADASVGLVLADLPYGSTDCTWDTRIDAAALWHELRRVLSPRGVAVMFADMKYAGELISSNRKQYRYELVWRKQRASGFLDAPRRPLRSHEYLLVFSALGHATYHPQMRPGAPYAASNSMGKGGAVYGKRHLYHTASEGGRYPLSVIEFPSLSNHAKGGRLHPTEKPLGLLDWVVRTYSDPGALVLDPTSGSGSTGEAALRAGRRFLGFEADPDHYAKALDRLTRTSAELTA